MSTASSSRNAAAFLSRVLYNNSRQRIISNPATTTCSPSAVSRRSHQFVQQNAQHTRFLRHFFTRRIQQQARPSSSSSTSHEAKQAAQQAAHPGFRARLTKLMRENGWVAIGIYTALSVLDFGLSFVLVSAVGADVMKKGERWVWAKLGFSTPEPVEEPNEPNNQPAETASSNFWTRAALAYGVHKTALLPVRVGLTAWITPATVRLLRSYGYKVGPGATSKVASKAAQEAAKKAP